MKASDVRPRAIEYASSMMRTNAIAPVACCLLLGACAPSATEARFDSPHSASRLYAIEKAIRTRNTAAVPQIIEQLDAADPVVRMMAIEALRILNDGQTYDYRFDDPDERRQAAIRRWVESVESATANPALYDDG